MECEEMNFYLAPMEGITGYVYRNAYAKYFGGVDKYFTPFITPDQNRYLNKKEKKDILPELNKGLYVVPQIMTNNASHFTGLQKELKELGYEEVNLNLGCPSATVVTKRKGAGLLAFPDKLDELLYDIFEKNVGKISIKTRVGISSYDEFDRLLDIFNKYEMEELIIHPRVREDFYKNTPDMETFSRALQRSKNKLVYNGDIHSVEAYKIFMDKFPKTETIMLGRGVLKNPTLISQCKCVPVSSDREIIMQFMNEILKGYYEHMGNERNVLFRMKELWLYLKEYFDNGDKCWKKINKAKNFKEYNEAIEKCPPYS